MVEYSAEYRKNARDRLEALEKVMSPQELLMARSVRAEFQKVSTKQAPAAERPSSGVDGTERQRETAATGHAA